MNWSDVVFIPSPRTLRQFAILWMLFFAGHATWQGSLANRASPAFLLTALAIGLGLAGLAKPALIRPIFVAWMIAAFPIGWIVSRVLLACIFYGTGGLVLSAERSGRSQPAARSGQGYVLVAKDLRNRFG